MPLQGDAGAELPPGLSKQVLQAAPSLYWRSPSEGDKVYVHYTGRLTDANGEIFDSSKDKDPAAFFLGQGEVIKGWELAIPTMKESEVARITVAPEYAYGEKGMPPKIPSNATLVYDVELLKFECKDNLFGDWGCVRTVLDEGQGMAMLENGAEVEISIRAEAASDGRTLEQRQHFPYRIGSNELGPLGRVTDRALKDMKKSAKVELRCSPDYTFKNPSHKEVLIRIELHEIYEEEDVSPEKQQWIYKKQTREGSGHEQPRDAAEVQLIVEAVRGISGIVLACFDGRKVIDFISGNGQVCDALEFGARHMFLGERATITCSRLESCKDPLLGIDDLSAAGDKVMFFVELASFSNEAVNEMSSEAKVEFATQRKEVGSKLFREQRFLMALERYRGVLDLLSYTENFDKETLARANALKLTCQLNQAQCLLKTGDFFGAKTACDVVLVEEPHNVKALFRRATAQFQRRDFAESLVDIRRLLELEPMNAEAKRLLPQAMKEAKESDKRAKSMWTNMSKCLSAGSESGPELEFVFEPKPDGFPALYDSNPSRNTASVNAGDYRLYVGGGSINLAFGEFFKKTQGLKWEGKTSKDYQLVHEVLLRSSREKAGVLVASRDGRGGGQVLPSVGLANSFCRAGEVYPEEHTEEDGFSRFAGSVGSVFVDVFKADKRPLHDKNVAMLYVVGPKGEDCTGPKSSDSGPFLDKVRFLRTVERLGERALETVVQYNERQAKAPADERLPVIEQIRWCLVSGGVYKHGDTSKIDVAHATIRGMKAARGTSGLSVLFSYDEDSFKQAFELEKSEAAAVQPAAEAQPRVHQETQEEDRSKN